MDRALEKNRDGLLKLCGMGQILGWAMVGLFVLGLVSLGWGGRYIVELQDGWAMLVRASLGLTTDFLFTGLAVIVLSQLVRYFLDRERSVGVVLKYGHVVLYLFSLAVMFRGLYIIEQLAEQWFDDPEIAYKVFAGSLSMLVPLLAQMLILLGLGSLLRLAMPMIEESRTLV